MLDCATLDEFLMVNTLDEFIWAMDEDGSMVLSISLSFGKTLDEFRIVNVDVGSSERESFCVDVVMVTNVGRICEKLVRLSVRIELVVFKVVSVEVE